MFFDYHLHSNFSNDSEMTLDEICGQSLLVGLDEIAITDHYDPEYANPEISFEFDQDAYFTAITAAQEKYTGRLRIKKAMELGIQPHILDKCHALVRPEFDFVLGSFHTIQRKDLYNGDYFRGLSQWEAYRGYLEDVLYSVQNFDQYSVLGHLDVIRRYGSYTVVPDLMDDADCRNLIDEILRVVVAKGKGLEVNTSGYYLEGGEDPLPTRSILQRYRQLGGEILTTGSDSHYTMQIGYQFRETHQRLHHMGFRYLTTFEKMQPHFVKIEA